MLEDIQQRSYKNIMIVSPDVGGVIRARAIAKRIPEADLAIIDKRRPKPNEAQVMHIIGDVKDRDCIIVDDIVDTASTLCRAVEALKNLRKPEPKRVKAEKEKPVLSTISDFTAQDKK